MNFSEIFHQFWGTHRPRGHSPASVREHKRIVAHRARNWPNAGPWPPIKAGYLPKFRKGGGQREIGT